MTLDLADECIGYRIPTGEELLIPAHTFVIITQCFGDSITMNVNGNLVKLGADQWQKLGWDVEAPTLDIDPTLEPDQQVWAVLRTCYDPEIPVNIADLGLIYAVKLSEHEDSRDADGRARKHNVHIVMTLTAPGCGMGPILVEEIKHKISQLGWVFQVEAELVFDPPWTQELMTEAAKLELGLS